MSQSPRLSDDQLNRLAAAIEKRPEVASLIGYPVAAAAFLDLRDARRAAIPSPAAPLEALRALPQAPATGAQGWLSSRLRANSECAPWVIEEVKRLEAVASKVPPLKTHVTRPSSPAAPLEKGKEDGGPVATLPEASPRVERVQFTSFDDGLHPECDNAEYLEYETRKNTLTGEMVIISYGYRRVWPNGRYEWIKKAEAKVVQHEE